MQKVHENIILRNDVSFGAFAREDYTFLAHTTRERHSYLEKQKLADVLYNPVAIPVISFSEP